MIGDGPLRADLERQAADLPGVRFRGLVPHEDVIAAMQARTWDAMVLPSLVPPGQPPEGIPVALMEAMNAGVPVVSTPTGGIPELLQGGAGVLVAPGDAADLAQALRALSKAPDLLADLSRRGKARVHSDFNQDRVLEELERRLARKFQPTDLTLCPMLYAVIMAGGVGSRFWPRSRKASPKQFLRFSGDRSLIQTTMDRLAPIVPPERVLVVTHARYAEQTQQQLPDMPRENILAEPIARNTAPCIAFAAAHLAARDPQATMLVLPADHVIRDQKAFEHVVAVAVQKAQTPGALVTIGIEPTHPETGYGYIQYEAPEGESGEVAAHPVLTFAEKPDQATAERFVDSGDFVWNSGMFAWRVDSIQSAITTHLPDLAKTFAPVAASADASQDEEIVVKAYADCPEHFD